MKCGNCHQGHDSVAQVKECYRTVEPAPPENFDHQWSWHMQQDMRPVKPTERKREATREEQMTLINEIGARIPAGRYALRNGPKSANDISFIHVQRPDKGKWAGKTFVKRQLGPNLDRMPLKDQLSALTRISTDIEGSMALYGHELGICGNCGLPLTNEISRDYGIGPICRANLGFGA